MKCTSCDNPAVGLRDKHCARCGTPTTVNALIRQLGAQTRLAGRRLASVRCPDCAQDLAMHLKVCPFCGTHLTVGVVLGDLFQPVGQRGRHLLQHPPPLAKGAVQGLYLAGSLAGLGYLLLGLTRAWSWYLVGAGALSIPYFAMGLMVLAWMGPRPWLRRLAQHASGTVKLGLLSNLLSLLLLTEQLILDHWRASITLAGVVAAMWVGAHVAGSVLWPILVELREIFGRGSGSAFDPSQPQGRKGRFQ